VKTKTNKTLYGKNISGIFTIGSGIITISPETIKYFAENIPQIGIITTKSIGLNPREGYSEPVLCQFDFNGIYYRNAVGLTNPGIDEWIKQIKDVYPLLKNKFLLSSIFAQTPDEFAIIAKKLIGHTDGIELNLSCPHAKGYGMVIGSDANLVSEIIKAVKNASHLPVYPKLSPNINNLSEITIACEETGADGIVAINTVGPKETIEKHSGEPILSNKVGGESGWGIKNKAISCIELIRSNTNLPIIGMGGVSSTDDVRDFFKAGANYIGIGTSLVGMSSGDIQNYFKVIENDIENGTNNAIKHLNTQALMEYKPFTIKNVEYFGKDLFILNFNEELECKPGQFVFTWIPYKKEKPFSILQNKPLSLLIRKIGEHTNELYNLKSGDVLMIRGAYGKSFTKQENKAIVLIGGGTGIAPLFFYSQKYPNDYIKFYIGASKIDDINWIDKKFIKDSWVISIDEPNKPGKIVIDIENDIQLLEKEGNSETLYYVCGPDPMMEAISKKLTKHVKKNRFFFSLEKYMKCGVGLCGSCYSKNGLRTCVDGPMLNDVDL